MNGIPILTLLTVLPLVGAAIALMAGRHARTVAILTTLAALALALLVWTKIPANGSIGLVELAAWAPSLGIEYHLGVDGLGALMLVLSAIVTLMSVDAAHRVHQQPGLYFALVLMLEAGLFGIVHGAQFLPLVSLLGAEPDSCVLPHQALGRRETRARGNAVLCLHNGGQRRAAALLPGGVSFHRQHGLHRAGDNGRER